MLNITGLHHVAIQVADIPEAVAFYTGTLGFKEIETGEVAPEGSEVRWLSAPDGTRIDLIRAAPPMPDDVRHLAFEVADFDEAMKEIESTGITVMVGPGKRADGTPFVFCLDVDGNPFELAGR